MLEECDNIRGTRKRKIIQFVKKGEIAILKHKIKQQINKKKTSMKLTSLKCFCIEF